VLHLFTRRFLSFGKSTLHFVPSILSIAVNALVKNWLLRHATGRGLVLTLRFVTDAPGTHSWFRRRQHRQRRQRWLCAVEWEPRAREMETFTGSIL
jgi:hypothetical protein